MWNELDPDMIRTLSSFGLEARIDKYKGRSVVFCFCYRQWVLLLPLRGAASFSPVCALLAHHSRAISHASRLRLCTRYIRHCP